MGRSGLTRHPTECIVTRLLFVVATGRVGCHDDEESESHWRAADATQCVVQRFTELCRRSYGERRRKLIFAAVSQFMSGCSQQRDASDASARESCKRLQSVACLACVEPLALRKNAGYYYHSSYTEHMRVEPHRLSANNSDRSLLARGSSPYSSKNSFAAASNFAKAEE